MIVRVMGEGQYELPDGEVAELNGLDDQVVAAVEQKDEQRVQGLLEQMAQIVRDRGERLPDGTLSASELILPPADLDLEEAGRLFTGDGLIPDLPQGS